MTHEDRLTDYMCGYNNGYADAMKQDRERLKEILKLPTEHEIVLKIKEMLI